MGCVGGDLWMDFNLDYHMTAHNYDRDVVIVVAVFMLYCSLFASAEKNGCLNI